MTLQLTVSSMACSACSDTITNAVMAIDPTATVQADLKTKQVKIETQVSEAAIKNALKRQATLWLSKSLKRIRGKLYGECHP